MHAHYNFIIRSQSLITWRGDPDLDLDFGLRISKLLSMIYVRKQHQKTKT
jgi:hypothetical protein